MSVRDKIEEFEALNHSTDDGEPKNDANAVKSKLLVVTFFFVCVLG